MNGMDILRGVYSALALNSGLLFAFSTQKPVRVIYAL